MPSAIAQIVRMYESFLALHFKCTDMPSAIAHFCDAPAKSAVSPAKPAVTKNADARNAPANPASGTQFTTCFTSTKVQILTQMPTQPLPPPRSSSSSSGAMRMCV